MHSPVPTTAVMYKSVILDHSGLFHTGCGSCIVMACSGDGGEVHRILCVEVTWGRIYVAALMRLTGCYVFEVAWGRI